eukprot:SAG25_NODE_3090_length_1223_cov_1.423488_1_plen_74_part_00
MRQQGCIMKSCSAGVTLKVAAEQVCIRKWVIIYFHFKSAPISTTGARDLLVLWMEKTRKRQSHMASVCDTSYN